MDQIYVVKASGERQPYNQKQIRRSIRRAGIPESLENEVIEHIENHLYQNIPTKEVYEHIMTYLDKVSSGKIKGKYNLKRALMELGPSGYSFEKFVARIFEHYGYKSTVDVTMQGHCVSHEIDIILENNDGRYLVECKFHNRPGTRTNVKTSLYIHSRFNDIVNGELDKSRWKEAWLVTNTKCTVDAIAYAKCSGMKVISWGYPEDGNLQDMIEKKSLYPITCLYTLDNYHKRFLLNENIVLCKDILEKKDYFRTLHFKPEHIEKIIEEAGLYSNSNV